MESNSSLIKLLPHQEKHVSDVLTMLDGGMAYIDASPTGSGKTYTNLYVANEYREKYGYKIGVISPTAVVTKVWEKVSKEYGIDVEFILTYSELTSKPKKNKPTLVIRESEAKRFRPTKYFTELCEGGLFLIFDEFHYMKNITSLRHHAGFALSKEVSNTDKSKIALLSATPGDKTEHVRSILKVTGIVKHKDLIHWDVYHQTITPIGLADVFKKVETIDAEWVEPRIIPRTKGAIQLCYDLYINYIKDTITTEMPLPEIKAKKFMYNIFMKVQSPYKETLESFIIDLENAIAWDNNRETFSNKAMQANFGAITTALMGISGAKIPIILRGTKVLLQRQSKVVICVNYIEQQKEIVKELGDRCAILNGEVSPKDRNTIIEKFQEDNQEIVCLVMTPGVGGIGINLHDTVGTYPRYMLVVPDFYHDRLHQTAGRVYRTGTQSDATIYMVYGDVKRKEARIIHAIARKTNVANELITGKNDIKFPGDYERVVEGEKGFTI